MSEPSRAGPLHYSLADGGHSAAFYNDTHNEPGGAYADRGLGARPSLSHGVDSPLTAVSRPGPVWLKPGDIYGMPRLTVAPGGASTFSPGSPTAQRGAPTSAWVPAGLRRSARFVADPWQPGALH